VSCSVARAGSRTASGLPPGQGLDRISSELRQLVEEQDAVMGQCSGMTPERREFAYDVGSTTLVTTQRCLPILRSRTNPSFS
jgi:hypothetical protein